MLDASSHLSADEKERLRPLLEKHESLFDGTLGCWKGVKHHVELKDPNGEPVSVRPYPAPRTNRAALMTEIQRLVKIGVLREINRSEWGAPSMVIPKKDKTVRFISDFRKLNEKIKRKPYPLPNIKDILQNLVGFRYGTTLDLNMGYYHIELTPESKSSVLSFFRSESTNTSVCQWAYATHQTFSKSTCLI